MSQNAQTPAPAKPRRPQPPPARIPPEFNADAIMKMDTAALVRVLQDSSSTRFQKSKACMRLAQVGDKSAVPALAAILSNPEMAHYARFGLVPIPDPSVDAAFRSAAGTLKGSLLINVIDAMGGRRNEGAIAVLAPFITGTDKDAAHAAITAIGMISGAQAATVLKDALGKTEGSLRKEVAAACLTCAEGLLTKGQRQESLALLARLTETDIPKAERLGAMNAIIATETAPGRPK